MKYISWSPLHILGMMIINNKIKEYRKKHQLTQRELAEKVGVTERTIISLEKGRYKPSIVLAYKLVQFFETDIETLFCLNEYVKNEQAKGRNAYNSFCDSISHTALRINLWCCK